MAQQFPVLITIILSTLAIVGVVFWRLRPQGDAAGLAAKLADTEKRLLDAERMASAKAAQAEQLTIRAQTAEDRLAQVEERFEAATSTIREYGERAARAEQTASEWRERHATLAGQMDAVEAELVTTRQRLTEAVAKQEADESAARRFEGIGQKVLGEALEQAHKKVDELAKTLKEGSGEELGRHAEAVAKTLEPLQQKIEAYDKAVAELQKNSSEAYGGLKDQIKSLTEAERMLHDQAQALTTALSAKPKMRGTFGEVALRQIVEFAGMMAHCHFEEQATRDSDEGRKIPDLVVSLPEGQKVLVDSKAVMDACVQALQATDETERLALMKKHCENVRSRVVDLSSKNYFAQHQNAVEAVVMFLPAEYLYVAAMEHDPDLTEFAAQKRVIIAGPNSLLMLLRVANSVWKQAMIADEARRIVEQGNAIHKAAADFVANYVKLGDKINQLGDAYSKAAGTLDSRLIPAARKMEQFQALTTTVEIDELPTVSSVHRSWRSDEARLTVASFKSEGPALLEFAATDVEDGGAQ